MPTSPSTRLGLIGPAGTDTIALGDDQIRAIITQLEAVGAGFEQGTSRPAAAAALAGYFYINTSTGIVSYCTGSVWLDFQPYDSDLVAIAALATTSYGRSLLTAANAAALRTLAGLGALSTLATVGTSEISDGSVTPAKRATPVQASTTGAGVMTTPSGTAEVNCLGVSLTGTGRPVLVNWSLVANNSNSGANRSAGARIRLDGGTIIGIERTVDLLLWSGGTDRHQIAGTGIVTPSAGAHTYGMYVDSSAGSAVDFRDGEITVVEL